MNIKKLTISNDTNILVDIGFSFDRSMALVGESGSGKSLTLKAILEMLPKTLSVEIVSDFKVERGKNVAFVPQNPFTALSPLTKIKDQLFMKDSSIEELFKVLDLELSLLKRYPSELSGGQLQRVVIAMALSIKPKLLLLDEPTTALDPKSRDAILLHLKTIAKNGDFMMLFVTHDINSARYLCDDICIIKNGNVVESGKTSTILANPTSIYTKTLIEANFATRNFRE